VAGGCVDTLGGVAGVGIGEPTADRGEADGVIVSGFASLIATPSLAAVSAFQSPVAVSPSLRC
jgi:hypothetical protein